MLVCLQKSDVDTTPRLLTSRRAILWRTLSALLFCATTGLLVLVLSNAIWILHNSPSDEEPSLLLAAYSVVPSLAVIGFVLCLTRRVRPRITFLGFIISAGLIAILATDDIRRSELPDYGPVAATDSVEYLTYMQMAEGIPDNLTQQVTVPAKSSDQLIATDPETWQKFIFTNHDRIVREWEEDEVGQSWLIDMADLPKNAGAIVHSTVSGPILAFRPVRAAASHRLAYALLLASEGNADEAASHLIVLLRACQALQRIGVGALDEMIASVILKKTYAGIAHLLDDNTLSVTARTELADSVGNAPDITLVISRTVIGEAQTLRDITDRLKRWEMPSMHLSNSAMVRTFQMILWRFAYLPYQTEREFLEFYQAIDAMAVRRELDQLREQATCFEQKGRSAFALRNPVGHKLHALSAPSFEHLTKLWAQEDVRRTLFERLKLHPAATAP